MFVQENCGVDHLREGDGNRSLPRERKPTADAVVEQRARE